MNRITIIVLSTFFITALCFSQDIIKRKTGKDIPARVMEITPTEIKYWMADSLEGTTITLLKSEVFMICYEDGTKDIFSIDTNNYSAADLCNQGQFDSQINYRGKHSGIWGTFLTATFLTPLVGLIPTIICSSAEPTDKNIMITNPELMKDTNYNQCYKTQSHKTKKTKIWISYGLGSAFWIVGILIIII